MSKKSLGIVVAFVIAIAACGSSSSKSSTPDTKSPKTTTSSSTPPDSSSPDSKAADPTSTTLQLVDTALGKVVADSDGKVLYLYVPDGTSTVSKVSAGVLTAWPPVLADGTPTVGPGLTAKPSTGKQPNDEEWVMYNGHLLYGFTGDTAAGDVNGNALGDVWYAVTAAGEPVQS